MGIKLNKAALVGAAVAIAIAKFDLFAHIDQLLNPQAARLVIPDDAPGRVVKLDEGVGLTERHRLGIDPKFYIAHQIHFGIIEETFAVTNMLAGQEARGFAVTVAADPDDNLVLWLMIAPDSTCGASSDQTDVTLGLGSGEKVSMKTECWSTEKGMARQYTPVDSESADRLVTYISTSTTPSITYPHYGPVPFDLRGFDKARQAALNGPRLVPDSTSSLAAN